MHTIILLSSRLMGFARRWLLKPHAGTRALALPSSVLSTSNNIDSTTLWAASCCCCTTQPTSGSYLCGSKHNADILFLCVLLICCTARPAPQVMR